MWLKNDYKSMIKKHDYKNGRYNMIYLLETTKSSLRMNPKVIFIRNK